MNSNWAQELAAAYCPEWRYTSGTDEPGSVLLDLGVQLLADNEEAVRALPQAHRRRFLEALGIPAPEREPMLALLRFSGTEGAFGCGDRFFAQTEAGDTSLVLAEDCVFSDYTPVAVALTHSTAQKVRVYPFSPTGAVRPFSGEAPAEGEYTLTLSHPTELRYLPRQFFLQLRPASTELARLLCNPDTAHWSLHNGREDIPLEPKLCSDGWLLFELAFPIPHGSADFCLRASLLRPFEFFGEALLGATLHFLASGLKVESFVEAMPAIAPFRPFSDEPSPGSCCYFSCESAFLPEHSRIVLRCSGDYTAERRFPSLFIVPEGGEAPQPVPCRADRVVFEYWNGEGWEELPEGKELRQHFAKEDKECPFTLSFAHPADWQRMLWAGKERYWLRLRLLEARHLYDPLCELCFPNFITPEAHCDAQLALKITVRDGFREENSSSAPPLLRGLVPDEDYLYFLSLGTLRSPLRLYFDLEPHGAPACMEDTWEYSDASGAFHPLPVQDGTENLMHSGILTIPIPEDFAPHERFGRAGHWLRVRPLPNASLCIRAIAANYAVCEVNGPAPCCGTEVFPELAPDRPVHVYTATECLGEPPDASIDNNEALFLAHLGHIATTDDIAALLPRAFPEICAVRVIETKKPPICVELVFRDGIEPGLALYLRREAILRFLKARCVRPHTFHLHAVSPLMRGGTRSTAKPQADAGFTVRFQNALSQIPARGTRWNSLGRSDPGVTILETMTLLADEQRYYCDALTDRHRLAYCALLGLRPRRAVCARGLLICCAKNHLPVVGAAVRACGVPFEVAGQPRRVSRKDMPSARERAGLLRVFPNDDELWAVPVLQLETAARHETWSGDGIHRAFPLRAAWDDSELWEALTRGTDGLWRPSAAAPGNGDTLVFQEPPPRGTKNILLLRWKRNFDAALGETDGTPSQSFALPKGAFLPASLHIQISERDGWRDLALCTCEAPEHAPRNGLLLHNESVMTGDGRSFVIPPSGRRLRIAGFVRSAGHCALPTAINVDNALLLLTSTGRNAQTPQELLESLPEFLQKVSSRRISDGTFDCEEGSS